VIYPARLLILLTATVPLLAQATHEQDSPWLTALIGWLPVVALIGLWLFFMRRMGGKGGYREYMRISQQSIVGIEKHLSEIAAALRKIADRN